MPAVQYGRVKPRKGATSTRPKRDGVKKGRLVLKIIVFLVCLPLSIVMLYDSINWSGLHQSATAMMHKPVEHIAIKGQFNLVEKKDIQVLVSNALKGDFMNVDLLALKHAIEQNAWVHKADLNRAWPSSLEISITEQKPIARWNNEGFLNQYGDLIYADISGRLKGQPVLNGTPENSHVVAKMYLDLSIELAKYQLKINQLTLNSQYSWSLVLKNGVKLVFGENDVIIKLSKFLYVYEQHLRAYFNTVKKIDLRYDNGLAVAWHNTTF